MFADGPSQVAQDVFRRTTDLGGHLIVAFVAPVGAAGSSSSDEFASQSSLADAEAASARALLQLLIDQVRAPIK
jgi:hypothetical protein